MDHSTTAGELRVEAERADAERRTEGVDDGAADAQFGLQGVAVLRGREVPQPRSVDGEFVGLVGPFGDGDRGGRAGGGPAVGADDP
jgi:hypothetical protein